jgi:hypothetical protein
MGRRTDRGAGYGVEPIQAVAVAVIGGEQETPLRRVSWKLSPTSGWVRQPGGVGHAKMGLWTSARS